MSKVKYRYDSLVYFMSLIRDGLWVIKEDGSIWALWERRRGFLKTPKRKDRLDKNGYLTVRATMTVNGIQIVHCVCSHRLVWSNINGIIGYDREINHKDCNKLNNHIDNLESVTRKENVEHAKLNGLFNPAKEFKNHRCILSDKDVDDIRKMLMDGVLLQREIADLYGVRPNQISRINTNKRRIK